MIFSEPSFSVEHQQSGLSALLRASRSRCPPHHKRESRHHVSGCDVRIRNDLLRMGTRPMVIMLGGLRKSENCRSAVLLPPRPQTKLQEIWV
jgi:hypothetical protein